MFVNREKVSKKREEGIVKPLSRKCDAARSNSRLNLCAIYVRVERAWLELSKEEDRKTLNGPLDEK